jgi:adenosine deaminase
VRTGVVPSIEQHPLPALRAAGVPCSINTDDPAMFNTDLGQDYAAAAKLGVTSDAAFEAGLRGALIDDLTRNQLRALAAD